MGIWKRFTRWMKSVFGGAINAVESPHMILEENMRELNDQIPAMNEGIASIKANARLLKRDKMNTEKEIEQARNMIRSAINQDRDDIAQKHALTLERKEAELERITRQLEQAHNAYDKAVEVKKVFMREKEKKINKAKQAIRENERAKMQASVADSLEQFEIGGSDQTFDEMMRRLDEETAKNEARVDMALDSVDGGELQIKEDAEEMRAAELVNQFKVEMGADTKQLDVSNNKIEMDLEAEEIYTDNKEKTIGRVSQ